MRVLQVVHGFPPRSTAGVEVYAARLAAALVDRGHEVVVLSAVHDLRGGTGSLRRRRVGGIEVIELVNVRDRPGLEASYADPRVALAGRRVLEELLPDVVHVQHLHDLSVELLAQARGMGAAVLMTLHDYWLSCPRDGLRMREDGTLCATVDHRVCAACLRDSPHLAPALQRGLVRAAHAVGAGGLLHRLHDAAPRLTAAGLRALRAPAISGAGLHAADLDRRAARLSEALRSLDAIVAPTRFVARKAIESGAPESRLHHVPLGVALPRLPRTQPARRFAYVGSLAAHKGVHTLVEAFRRLGDPELRLDVHGDPTVHPGYAARLRASADGDARIRFRGRFAEGEQARVFGELDVVVVPSLWWENSPIVLLEARASGARVVASRTGGVPELLPEAAGQLVEPGDVDGLHAALAGEAGRAPGEVPPPRTLDAEVSELTALYLGLTGERGVQRRAVG